MLIVGRFPYGFVFRFDEDFFRRIKLEARLLLAMELLLQLLFLTVNTTVPMQYQFHLTCIKDEHLKM